MGIKEIEEGLDQHTHNQTTFGLPSRLIAKIFIFRLIFGGGAYSYANDPEFKEVGFNEKQWQGVIDKFYEKYYGIAKWHISLMQEVNETGGYSLPTGRSWKFKTYPNFRGEPEWPRTQILNYKVQGFSADLMKLVRIAAFNRIKPKYPEDKVKFIATVHDDVELDCYNDPILIANICETLEVVCSDLPVLYEKYFKQPFNVPMSGEVSYGHSLANMIKYKKGVDIII